MEDLSDEVSDVSTHDHKQGFDGADVVGESARQYAMLHLQDEGNFNFHLAW